MNWTSRQFHILSLSADHRQGLRQRVGEYITYLSNTSDHFGDICYKSNINGSTLKSRLAVVEGSKEKAIKKLKKYLDDESIGQGGFYVSPGAGGGAPDGNGKVAFLFTGQGSHYPGMAREFYESLPGFRQELDCCDELFSRHIGQSLTRLLYSGNTGREELNQAVYAQPIIFSVQCALYRLWESLGITPSVVLGHSIGEYAAAYAAGVFKLEEAVELVAARGTVLQQVPDDGKMVGVLMSEARAKELIAPYSHAVSVAAVNSPQNVTLSGSREPLEQVIRKVKQERFFVEHLDISHPFHSIRMTPYVETFKAKIGDRYFSKPAVQIVSTITGREVREEMSHADYWCSHIRNTVRFYDAVKTVEKQGIGVFVEVGGTATLCGLAGDSVQREDAFFLPSLRKGNNPWRQFYTSLAQLYVMGIDIDWAPLGHAVDSAPPTGKSTEHTDDTSEENIMRMDLPPNDLTGNRENTESGKEKTAVVQPVLKHMLEIIAGLDPESIEENASLFSLGIDSLMLVQLRKKINDEYRVDITVNDFFTTYTTLKKITDVLVERMPREEPAAEAVPAPAPPVPAPEPRETPVEISMPPLTAVSSNPGSIDGIISKQLELMNRQHQKMAEIMEKQSSIIEKQLSVLEKTAVPVPHAPQEKETPVMSPQTRRSMPIFRFNKMEKDDLTARQQAFIAELIARYNARTPKSKEYAQTHREELSDWINSLNFRMSLKELVYPIVSCRSQGSRLWDIDGNEYIDIAIGFGTGFFGHRPAFVVEALEKQVKEGYELGTQSVLAGEVARLICRLANVERVAFSNSGTEAVMVALRLARAVTGRKTIVRFSGSYHGSFDGILADADEYGTFPISPGTPQGMVEDVVVLPYGSRDSLEKIESLGEDVAGVLVEPVQSRRPGFHPREFLHQLREITIRTGAAFILDDVYVGFRIHQGGCQAHFDVEADIVTFGKVIGGGLPIGVTAGKARFLDAIDGGYWDYGDESFPQVSPTFFAGTFCRHPLVMAAAHASLKYMEQQGPQLQERLNERTRSLVEPINEFFEKEDVPIRVKHFGSLFRFESFGAYDLAFNPIEMDLFFHLVIEKGVYLWERRICCLSVAHTDEDVRFIIEAVKQSIKELRQGGFSFSSAGREEVRENEENNVFPLAPAQQGYFVLNRMKGLERAVHLAFSMSIEGPLAPLKLQTAMETVIRRHDVFRVSFEMEDGEMRQRIHEPAEVDFKIFHQTVLQEGVEKAVDEFIRPFDLSRPPLLRLGVFEFSPDRFFLVLDTHHLVSDGETADMVIQELGRLYRQESLPPVDMGLRHQAAWWKDYLDSPRFKTQEEFWKKQFPAPFPPLQLPTDFPRPAKKDYRGGLVQCRVETAQVKSLKQVARDCEATLFMVLLAAYFVLLYKLSDQQDIAVGIPISIRGERGFETLPGYLTNNVVCRCRLEEESFGGFLKYLQGRWLEVFIHREYPYERLVEAVEFEKDRGRNPLFDAMFIYENVGPRRLQVENTVCELHYPDLKISVFDLTLEVSQQENRLDIKLYYSTGLFKKETVEKWAGYYGRLLEEIAGNCDVKISSILGELKNRPRQADSPPEPRGGGEAGPSSRPRPPANDIEKQLLQVWQQELNTRDIGPEDNFFERGGRSYDTIRTVSRINRQLGTRISLTAIFEYPTVAELARQVEGALASVSPTPAVNAAPDIPPAPSRPAYPLSPPQMRYWVTAAANWQEGDVETTGVDITGDVLIFKGTLDYDCFKQALAEVFNRHDILRTTYEEQKGAPVQIVHSHTGSDIPIEYCDLSGFPPAQRDKRLSGGLLEAYKKVFGLNRFPLIRFYVYKLEDSRYALFLNAPHISFDGWSLEMIVTETAHFYNAFQAGHQGDQVPPLPPVRRYVDYVEWHKERLETGQLDGQADYWTEYLKREIPVTCLPYDYDDETPVKADQLEPSRVYRFKLDAALTGQLHEAAARNNTTMFVTMLAILEAWIAGLSHETVITVGSIFSGRTYPELENIPGIMMNLLPIRTDLSGNPDSREILVRTRKTVQATYDNQDHPLDLVAHRMRKTIDFNRDIYSIAFIAQEALGETGHFDGLEFNSQSLVSLISGRTGGDDGFLDGDYDIFLDLLVEMFEEAGQIKFLVRYNRRRFRSETVKKYFDHFKSMVPRFLDPSNLHLSQLSSPGMSDLDELF